MTHACQKSGRVSILAFSSIASDARVLRQAEYLNRQYSVCVFGYGERPTTLSDEVKFVSIPTISTFSISRKAQTFGLLVAGRATPARAYETLYWRRTDVQALYDALRAVPTDFIHANDWLMLPVAQRVARETGAAFLLDLHEYAPEQFVNRPYRRHFYRPMVDYFLRRYAADASASVTVGDMIAERYARDYGFRPEVIRNAPGVHRGSPAGPTNAQQVNLVHHGALIPDRELERMIDCIGYANARFNLHFLLVGANQQYLERLKSRAADRAPGRIFFHAPVAPTELPARLAEYDIGFFLLPPTSFSYAAALPNKFFDFLAAGLAIGIGPSPEMASLIRRYECGFVSETFEPDAVARDLDALDAAAIDRMKYNARIAHQTLNADIEMDRLLGIYAELSRTNAAKHGQADLT